MRYIFSLFLILFIFKTHAQIVNIESLRMEVDSNGLSGKETFLFNITQNTSRLISINNNLSLQWRKNAHLLMFLNDINITFSESTDFEKKGFFHLRYNYQLDSLLTLEAFAQYQVDLPLRIASRQLIGAGPRLELNKQENSSLIFGSLLMYEYDRELGTGITHRDMRLSNYLSLGWQKKNFKLSNLTYYQPRLNYWSDFRLSTQLQLEMRLYKSLWFAFGAGVYYDAFPVEHPSVPKFTYKLVNGLTVSF